MTLTPAAVTRKPSSATAPKALLQLSASRGKLALELAEPFDIGPLRISTLISSLDNLDFPVDLSGGVARFRHRRGSLELLAVETRLAELARFLEPKARSALDSPALHLSLLPASYGLTVGIHDEDLAIAFTAWFAPDEDRLRFVIGDARGFGAGQHPLAVALRLARTLCNPNAEREGSVITLDRPLSRLVREALLDAGARLPSCHGTHFDWMDTDEGVRLVASRSGGEGTPPPHVVRGVELARIAHQGDDALVAGRLDDARSAYIAALEAAPRHPALVLRIAELDMIASNNPESALASIVEAMPAVDGGLVAAHLLDAVGDRQAAAVAARRAAEDETFAPLASRILANSATYTSEVSEQLAALDEALARCPSCASIRWQRARARIDFGQFDDAIADLGQLEMAARGASARFDVCLAAGKLLLDTRLHRDARMFFERALRYAPRSAQASLGLARAFLATGAPQRGVALLSRAVSLLQAGDPRSPVFVLDLAKALAEHAQDLPAAIYHARSVPFGIRETVAARALEGQWRDQLDDRIGASQAFAQAREAAAQLPRNVLPELAPWLVQAAFFELDVVGNPRAAKRHAELALQGCPHDPTIKALFQRAARSEQDLAAEPRGATPQHQAPVGAALGAQPESPDELHQHGGTQEAASPETEPPPAAPATIPPPAELDDLDAEIEAEQRIESLTDVVRANPNDGDAVRELCALLESARRHLDLLALVSARLEETTDQELVATLKAAQRRTLAALIATCRAEGRPEEAEMYEFVLADLEAGGGDG